jgi:hypothetical protein
MKVKLLCDLAIDSGLVHGVLSQNPIGFRKYHVSPERTFAATRSGGCAFDQLVFLAGEVND